MRSRFCVMESVGKPSIRLSFQRRGRCMGNHKGGSRKSRHRGFIHLFLPLIAALLGTDRAVMRTGDKLRLKTLLAAMNTSLADWVILPPAVLSQEEGPFQFPFLASAHSSPRSGGFFCGTAFSGALRPAHSRLASSSRSMIEGFFSGAASLAFSTSSPRRPLLITPSIMP